MCYAQRLRFCAERKGNCRSNVLKARVLGVYGVLDIVVVRRPFISHSLSEALSETGESFICISSTLILFAAR
jgi:hypothetical protein